MSSRIVAAAAVLAVPLSFGLSLPASAEGIEDEATATAVRAVTAPESSAAAQAAAMPPGFSYRAEPGPGFAVNPHGGCSSVLPLPSGFDAPCKAHDLGYDLLRHADAQGRPLGAWARVRIDDAFEDRLQSACGSRPVDQRQSCSHVADVVMLSVRANTWRQHDGPPRDESARDLAASWLTAGGRL
ncbi:phospholipase A2 [Tsukamurella sp. 1534]|uniref:phospholipase A2 n=1 Tax=Tsukamurella sp. 1534 TaxID=1151061 RepID=UPI0011D1B1B2|nr:phospholipase A2 [Tsukamurella sp. 1534]